MEPVNFKLHSSLNNEVRTRRSEIYNGFDFRKTFFFLMLVKLKQSDGILCVNCPFYWLKGSILSSYMNYKHLMLVQQ